MSSDPTNTYTAMWRRLSRWRKILVKVSGNYPMNYQIKMLN